MIHLSQVLDPSGTKFHTPITSVHSLQNPSMAGPEKRNHQYLLKLALRLSIQSTARSYREVRLILKARLVKTVADNLCNSAYLAEENSIRGANSAMTDDDAYMWSALGISSSRGVLPFTHHLVAPSNMF